MEFNGLFGKIVAELIAEGQADPSILKELYVRHVGLRRAFTIALIEREKAAGEFLRRHRWPSCLSMQSLHRRTTASCSASNP